MANKLQEERAFVFYHIDNKAESIEHEKHVQHHLLKQERTGQEYTMHEQHPGNNLPVTTLRLGKVSHL